VANFVSHFANAHWLRDPKHIEWVNSYVAIFTAMQSYVKEYHSTGLVWNPRVCHSYIFLFLLVTFFTGSHN
jgi:hypothetical protein